MTKPARANHSDIRIGISGWRYTPWRGSFYPKGLVQKRELYFASRTVNSIEINGSFYALQNQERYQNWYDDTPDDFMFSVKGPKFITHIHRLRDVEQPISNFFASGVLALKNKLGPILWQFPPTFKFDHDLFKAFLKLLPTTTDAAIQVAKENNIDVDVTQLQFSPKQRLRYSIEIRNESFRDEKFIHLLREFNVALVVADTAGRWPQLEDITSDFVYMRLHGDAELYKSGYTEEARNRWYKRIKCWSEGKQPEDAKLVTTKTNEPSSHRDVFCYFDNTDKLWAPQDARAVLEKLHLADNLEAEPGKRLASIMPKKKTKTETQADLF
ncbi:MAG: DUF72 domain-containing protein [Moraxellaceae bacterium]|nr:MAG: DUF72 domain-containing protein [Moraxellaceae bacterium]